MNKDFFERYDLINSELALIRALNKAMEPMLREQALEKALPIILETAIHLIPHSQTGSLLIKEGKAFKFKAAYGFDLEKLKKAEIPLESSVLALGKGSEVLKIKNLAEFDRENLPQKDFQVLWEYGGLSEIKVSLIAPLMLPGGKGDPWDPEETIGQITVNNMDDEEAFSDISCEILAILAKQASLALWRAQVYSELQYKESLLQDLLDHAQEGIWRVNKKGETVFVNPRMEKILGYSKEELMGKPAHLFIYQGEPEKGKRYERRRSNGIEETFEDCLKDKDGNPVWVELKVSPLKSPSGEVLGSQILLIDITDRRALEKAKDDLLYAFSHEMKTPITSLNAAVEKIKIDLKDGKLPDHRLEEFLPIFDRNLLRIQSLANNILDAQKGWKGEEQEQLSPLNLKDVVLEALRLELPQAITKGLEVETDLPESFPEIFGERERLIQVFLNLISNAIRFSSKGKIKIFGYADLDSIKVTISDEGIGMPPEEVPLVFTPFYRPLDETRRVYAGLGLGLYVAKKILEKHGGEISLKSEQGKGTTVTVTLSIH
ncbi:MAG: ATP-binding protein [Caldiserica bacterium]|jgi:PAS domain S-box-containing protein|nr:ATP-binding protein [Caldisericota bacterium]MDH7562657.1 ATP-binding protein [Caldisericota bacterium]